MKCRVDNFFDAMTYILTMDSQFYASDITTLYHYTNNSTAQKNILKDPAYIDFRLTKVKDFLDKNEGNAILEPYLHACGHLVSDSKISSEFHEILISFRPNSLKNRENTWVLCFSKNGNSKFLKERYSAKESAILSFHSEYFENLEFEKLDVRCRLIQVCYSFPKMKQVFEKIMKKLYCCYHCEIENGMPKKDAKNWVTRCLHSIFDEYSLHYKDATYKKEEEIRLICQPNPEFCGSSIPQYQPTFFYGTDGKLHLSLPRKRFLKNVLDDICWQNSSKLNSAIISYEELRRESTKAMAAQNRNKDI